MDSEESVIIMVYRQIVREKIYKNQEHCVYKIRLITVRSR